MTKMVALEVMCNRCINHDICMGTGCAPKNTLEEFIQQTELMEKDNGSNLD